MNTEEAIHNDASLEAMLGQVQPEHKCKSGNPIERMCINNDCDKPSLICQKSECQKCQGDDEELHMSCSSFPLKGVTSQLEKITKRQQNFLNNIFEIESKFIDDLRGTREPLAQKYRFGNLEERYAKVVLDKIYSGRQNSSLKGKEAREFVDRLKAFEKEESQEVFEEFLKLYRKTFESFLREANQLKQRIIENELDIQKSRAEMKNIVLNPPLSINLLGQLRQDQIDFLNASLGNPHKIQRIFKASEHQFKATAFHQACDGKNDTLVLARTEFGKTIGGYSYYPWSNRINNYITDAKMSSFIFSLDLKEKYIPQSTSNLIYCHCNNGPTFGAGHDLYLADSCNKKYTSYAKFPSTFNLPGEDKIGCNQESFKNFSGATNTSHFRVLEYEVFQVVYQ